MSTITAGATLAVNAGNGTTTGSSFNTNPAASGTFIPALWSAKLNAKFYAASVFADICNRNWEGEIANLGDKVVINNIPNVSVTNYTIGMNLTYQAPVPSTVELTVDKGKAYAFALSDVLSYQSKPDLMGMFTDDAAQQMRTVIDSNCLINTFDQGSANNMGATAGVKSTGFNLGTNGAPVTLSGANVLQKILELAAVLDEQNVPESGRWLVIDPLTRTLLMQSNLAQAQFMGDDKSAVRNGLIGTIDRFKVYVSNLLPYGAAGADGTSGAARWTSGYGDEFVNASGAVLKRRAIIAGHTAAIAFASQMTKNETLRNPNDFGDLVRGLQIYGYKVVRGEALALLIAA